MDKLQAALCTAHKHTEDIKEIINEVESNIDRNQCKRELLENFAILALNLPLIKFALENILDISGIVVTTNINEKGEEFTRYLEDAKVELEKEETKCKEYNSQKK